MSAKIKRHENAEGAEAAARETLCPGCGASEGARVGVTCVVCDEHEVAHRCVVHREWLGSGASPEACGACNSKAVAAEVKLQREREAERERLEHMREGDLAREEAERRRFEREGKELSARRRAKFALAVKKGVKTIVRRTLTVGALAVLLMDFPGISGWMMSRPAAVRRIRARLYLDNAVAARLDGNFGITANANLQALAVDSGNPKALVVLISEGAARGVGGPKIDEMLVQAANRGLYDPNLHLALASRDASIGASALSARDSLRMRRATRAIAAADPAVLPDAADESPSCVLCRTTALFWRLWMTDATAEHGRLRAVLESDGRPAFRAVVAAIVSGERQLKTKPRLPVDARAKRTVLRKNRTSDHAAAVLLLEAAHDATVQAERLDAVDAPPDLRADYVLIRRALRYIISRADFLGDLLDCRAQRVICREADPVRRSLYIASGDVDALVDAYIAASRRVNERFDQLDGK